MREDLLPECRLLCLRPTHFTLGITSLPQSIGLLTSLYTTVPHRAYSLFLALERTFLGYLRTSLALSFLAVIIAQFFRLQHSESPDHVLGYYVLGTPLAAVCIVAAIIVLLLGALRFWRQQNAILRGKVHAGGLELNSIGLVILLVWICVRSPST